MTETPMIKQYKEIKASHNDAILFFRLGDFYEMFYEDAEIASRELELTLTGRGKKETDSRMPMCGVPYHAADNYIYRLINKGYKVAICEQTEDPALAKGLTRREVIKIITPGTIVDTKMIPEKDHNYLAAVYEEDGIYGFSYADSTTGEFKITEISNSTDLKDEIARINPKEILIDEKYKSSNRNGIKIDMESITYYETDKNYRSTNLDHFKVKTLDSFGVNQFDSGLKASAAIINYLKGTQKSSLSHLNKIIPYSPKNYMFLDSSTRRNLELTQSLRNDDIKGSLLWILDQTKTAMGGRLLRNWIIQPLLDIKEINKRQDSIDELTKDLILREELKDFLKDVYDIERLAGKIANNLANAKDLIALKESLKVIPNICESIKNTETYYLKRIFNEFKFINTSPEFSESIINQIEKAIVDSPPNTIGEGGIIKDRYNNELDEIKKTAKHGKDWVIQLEKEEKEKSGIKSLKIGYNKVFGYYIEVTNANLPQVPEYYIRKQTLTNGERFITPELKEKETMILNAESKLVKIEYEIFVSIREEISKSLKELQKLAEILSEIDCLLSLSDAAVKNNYKRPKIIDSGKSNIIRIKNSRHPVLEKTLSQGSFVVNDIYFDNEDTNFIILTGPNMAGKSTYMRQIALIILMAQIGSFVPADSAEISLVDRIFTRVGAIDDLFGGQSTFMVEMSETANILNNATENSLIILDEIGRGTSTYDGMSIAGAVAEYIQAKIKARTIFATHYHELTAMAKEFKGIKNYNVAVKEEGDKVTFLYKVVEGGADQSYGIHVAQLAGLPTEVISRAKDILAGLEKTNIRVEDYLGKKEKQMGLFKGL